MGMATFYVRKWQTKRLKILQSFIIDNELCLNKYNNVQQYLDNVPYNVKIFTAIMSV